MEKKGYRVLLTAVATLADSGRRVSCQIVGAGPHRGALEALIGEGDQGTTVPLLGARTHQEVTACYREAHVFVQTSVVLADGDRDGTPTSLLEAMASGLPVVAATWPVYATLSPERLQRAMRGRVVLDAVGVLDPEACAAGPLDTYGVGRGRPLAFYPVVWSALQWTVDAGDPSPA